MRESLGKAVPLLPPRLEAEEERDIGRSVREVDRELRKALREARRKDSERIRQRIWYLRRKRRRLEHRLVTRNLRLAAAFAHRKLRPGIRLDDLFQAGCLGMLQAAEKYDGRPKVRFGSYATWFIINRIIIQRREEQNWMGLESKTLERIIKFRREYRWKNFHNPGPEEIARALRIKPGKVVRYLKLMRGPVALDKPLGDEKDSDTFSSRIPDLKSDNPEELVGKEMLRERVRKIVREKLTPVQAEIVRLRFYEDLTLEAIGRRNGLTRERIRQIIQEIKEKLKPHLN